MRNLKRFTEAQRQDFDAALSEIQQGQKHSHWMWYIFPQIRGLGFSSMIKGERTGGHWRYWTRNKRQKRGIPLWHYTHWAIST